MADVQVLIDGPSAFRGWNEAERKRRRSFRRILGQLFLIPLFVCWLEFTRIPYAELGVLLATLFAVGIFAHFGPSALAERVGVVHGVGAACLGIIICTVMRAMNLQVVSTSSDQPILLGLAIDTPMWAGFAVCVYGVVVARCFCGWCLAIPDRDIMVRRQYARAIAGHQHNLGWRFGVVKEWALIGCFAFIAALPLLFPFPHYQPKVAVAVAVFTFGVGGLLSAPVVGCSPLMLLRTTWRALVVFHTYDVPQPGGQRIASLGVYTFPTPLRDHRLRVLMSVAVVAICSVSLCMATGWPMPSNLREVWMRFEPVQLLVWFLITVAKFVAIAFAFLFWIFLTLTGIVGPLVTMVYREFAEDAVNQAERSSL